MEDQITPGMGEFLHAMGRLAEWGAKTVSGSDMLTMATEQRLSEKQAKNILEDDPDWTYLPNTQSWHFAGDLDSTQITST